MSFHVLESRIETFVRVCLGATLLGAVIPMALAEEGISTDRPDFVESSNTVGMGVFQLETSVAFERDKVASSRLWTTPTLLRYGVRPDLELRLETDGFARSRFDDNGITVRQSGFSDTSLGLKWQQREGDEKGGSPGIAWLFHVDLDSGSADFRAPGKVPSLRVVAEWDLPDDASFGVMPGIVYDLDEQGRRNWNGILAATYSRPIAERTRGFFEIAAPRLASSTHGGNLVTVDTGMSYLIDKDTQIDTALFLGASRNAPDLAFTLGFSKRFP